MSSKLKISDGDWKCEKCENVNFARRLACNRCGKEKSTDGNSKKSKQGVEIGKAAAEKSHGLFSADDWQCNKCGNVNWARRQTCNMCNAPKYSELEERTGYGGGFNEREGVEYIERDESEDEYDEFGRKKKKFRTKPGSSKNKEDKKKIAADEEDDDDDDGDLSKYDLWGDDDEVEVKPKDEKNSKSEQECGSRSFSSRSRSRSSDSDSSSDRSSGSDKKLPSSSSSHRNHSRSSSREDGTEYKRKKTSHQYDSHSSSSSPERKHSKH